jgi:hypothetical protein
VRLRIALSTAVSIAPKDEYELIDERGNLYLPNKDFIPLLSSEEGEVKAEVVFVGYGTPKELAGLEACGRIVLLFINKEEPLEKGLDAYQKMIELGASAILLSAPAGNNDLRSIVNYQATEAPTRPIATYVDSKATER